MAAAVAVKGTDAGSEAAEQRGFAVAGIPAFVPVQNAFEMIRHFWGCIGYTFRHLPVRKDSAPLLNAVEATLASFAARMAFSSFSIRLPLR